MPKIMAAPNNLIDIERIIDGADAIVVGIENLSVNFLEIKFSDIPKLTEKVHSKFKKIFISINKNMHNHNLDEVTEILKKCEEIKIDGIFYCDVAILNIHNKLSLNIPLVWNAEHLATNYNTINYWARNGVEYAFLSNEITLDEIKEIKNNVSIPLIAQAFGYIPMYVSKRHAIDNYLKHFNLSTNSKEFYIFKEEKKYPILERYDNTEIYSYFILNAIAEYADSNMDYLLLNGFKIDTDGFVKVIDMFKTVTKENSLDYKEKIDSMFENTGLGFLYKEAIYQVKKNEK